MVAFLGMFEAPSAEVIAARQFVTQLVASEVLRQQADLERLLVEHVDSNQKLPKIVRAHLRRLAACQDEEDKFYFELLEQLWANCADIKNLRWTNNLGGRLIAERADGSSEFLPVFWSANHFRQHHAKSIAALSSPGRHALDYILESSGPWESIGLVQKVTEEGLQLSFIMPNGIQNFKRPLSPDEFRQRFKVAIAAMSYEAQGLIDVDFIWHPDFQNELEDVCELSEDRADHFVTVKFLKQDGLETHYLFEKQPLESFKRQFVRQFDRLPDDLRSQLEEHLKLADLSQAEQDRPWRDRGRITSLLLTPLSTIEMQLRDGGTYRYHPIMPAGEFIEFVLPELTNDSQLRDTVIRALNQSVQGWCRFGYAERLGRHIGGAVQLESEDGLKWYLFESQTADEFLNSFVRARKDLSQRAQDFIQSFVHEHPEYFDKLGLIYSIEEDRENDQVVFETLITNSETVRLSIL